MMQNVHNLVTYCVHKCGIISVERSVYKMKIVKLPACYVRYLQEIEKDGRRYIIASRHRFGSNTVEDVIVGVRV